MPSTTTTVPAIVHTPVVPSISSTFITDHSLWSVIDPDVTHENPVEDKHRRLVRSHRSSPYDRELKPNAKIRDELGVSLGLFPHPPHALMNHNIIIGYFELLSQPAVVI